MRVDIITLFPAMCEAPLAESIVGRARDQGLLDLRITDLRQFADDRHRTVDDAPYGGGSGMVLKAEPLFRAVDSVRTGQARVILLTPQGRVFHQRRAEELAADPDVHLVLVCGHYEGVDERARKVLFDDELSIGDYILTNGAIAAVVVVDAVTRLIPGVLGSDDSSQEESFALGGGLEYPQYTRPASYRSMQVPEVLLSGDHERIRRWRSKQSILRTASRRPELLQRQYGDTSDE